MFELNDRKPALVKVIGVGGGGCNAVAHMASAEVEGVELVYTNTDARALQGCRLGAVAQLGPALTRGLGAGADPAVGKDAALEVRAQLAELAQGADMVFVTAGMGGGTGTGAAPVIAQAAREQQILTVAVVTTPFAFEGRKRMAVARRGIEELGRCADSLITIPNERLLPVLGSDFAFVDAFAAVNDVLKDAVQGIAELITRRGLINVDFADVRTVMSGTGPAMMGSGAARGPERARQAIRAAVASPLLEDVDLRGARGILVNVTAGPSLSMGEWHEVGETVEALAAQDATVVVGTVLDEALGDELRVTVVATGLGQQPQARATPPARTEARPPAPQPPAPRPPAPRRPAPSAAPLPVSEAIDYRALEPPPFLRKDGDRAAHLVAGADAPERQELLNLRRFLRQQAP